jgi:hypothetical protein
MKCSKQALFKYQVDDVACVFCFPLRQRYIPGGRQDLWVWNNGLINYLDFLFRFVLFYICSPIRVPYLKEDARRNAREFLTGKKAITSSNDKPVPDTTSMDNPSFTTSF